MGINENVAANLKRWMQESVTLRTVDAVAERSGVGFGTVRRARNGDGNLTARNIEAIASAFRRTAFDLMAPVADPAPAANGIAEPPAPAYLGERRRTMQRQLVRDLVEYADALPDDHLRQLVAQARILYAVAAPPARANLRQ